MSDTKQEIGRFLSCFKRGEQVFVGFRGGYTYGYVSSVTKEGFGIVQLGKPKEYIYGWEHFEFVSSPGFRVKRLTEFEAVHLFSVVLTGNNPLPDNVKPLSLVIKSSDDLLIKNPSKFASSELQLTKKGKDIRIKIEVKSGEHKFVDEFWRLGMSLKYDSEEGYCAPPQDNELVWTGCASIMGAGLEACNGRLKCRVSINNARDLEKLRAGEKLEWFDPVELARAFGDPWMCEDRATYLGSRVWLSNEGYFLGNFHGDLYIGPVV